MVTKKTKSKTNSKKKPLVCAQFAQCFWVHDGPVLSDLSELKTFFEKISRDQWSHHVTKEKNDFANWVEIVLRDEKCAEGLRKAMTRTGALEVVETAIKKYHA